MAMCDVENLDLGTCTRCGRKHPADAFDADGLCGWCAAFPARRGPVPPRFDPVPRFVVLDPDAKACEGSFRVQDVK